MACADPYSSEPSTRWEDTPNLCRDQVDNDGDGNTDCDDPDCQSLYVCAADDDTGEAQDTVDTEEPDTLWSRIASNTQVFGSNDGDPSEAPSHVVLVRTFEIMRTEVTVAMYRECVAAGACADLASDAACVSGGYMAVAEEAPESYPMSCVSWHQASDFCEWLGARLPSETEWEKAARGSRDVSYPWGDDAPTCELAVIDDRLEAEPGCGQGRPWPVCSRGFEAMGHRLCDMIGNVREWVADDYHPTYDGAPTNGVAWIESPRTDGRMVRGGAYDDGPEVSARSRRWCVPEEGCAISDQMDGFGFRCAR